MKKFLLSVTSMYALFVLAGCTAMQGTPAQEPVSETHESPQAQDEIERLSYEGEISEPIVINTDKDIEITLNAIQMNFEGSCIDIQHAGHVKIILEGENNLTSTGAEPKSLKTDAPTTITGSGTINITSSDTCIKSSDDLTIESGTFNLQGATGGNGLRANESLIVNNGTFTIDAGECLEATVIEINGGTFDLTSDDDAINASEKSEKGLSPSFTINGGSITITMAQGDTDGIDSNGDITINDGTINITAQSAFDWDGNLAFNGGTVIINGEQVDTISNQFEGGNPGMGPGEPWRGDGSVPPEPPGGF
ncbi:MAG: carbohydrate-binding domain-containing protein [Eggerthellaceae bacterium]|nr:carbohydrate-binding domain-containing protein [Eggerthellaceae bacterium]